MIKRAILGVLILFLMVSFAYAVPPVMITNSDGSQVSAVAKEKKSITGSGLLYSGSCKVLSVNMFSSTAGDNIGVYDATNLTPPNQNWLELELGISANNSSASYDMKGAPFKYGIYIVSSSATAVTTVVFDY